MQIAKGKKKCPKCQEILACRKSSCPCGHVFYETKAVEKKTSVSAMTAGPGRKQCGGCNTFVGVRNAKCPSCGYEFVKKETQHPAIIRPNPANEKNKSEKQEQVFNITGGTGNTSLKVCLVPAGACPVKVKEWTKEGLLAWASEVQLEEEKKGYALANEGLAYWARTFFTFWRDEEKDKLVKETFPADKEGI